MLSGGYNLHMQQLAVLDSLRDSPLRVYRAATNTARLREAGGL